MAKQWTPDEIRKFLEKANPNVRKLFRGLSKVPKATIKELKVPVPSVAIAMRVSKAQGKEPLHKSEKSKKGKPALYFINPMYKKTISDFLSTFREPKLPPKPKRRGRGKKVSRRKAGRKKIVRRRVRRKKAAKPVAATRRVPRVRRKARGRRRMSAAAASAQILSVPVTSLKDYEFWANVADKINSSRGKKIVVTTDGKEITLRTL